MPNLSALVSANTTAVAAAGGSSELITKTTISSNVTEIIFDNISAPQQQLLLIFNGLQLDNTGGVIMHFRNSSGGNMNNTGGSSDSYVQAGNQTNATNSSLGAVAGSTGAGHYWTNNNLWPGRDLNANINIYNFGTTITSFEGVSNFKFNSGSTNFQRLATSVVATTSAASAGIRLYATNSRNFSSGEVYLYKLV